jgi:hypothetical protein
MLMHGQDARATLGFCPGRKTFFISRGPLLSSFRPTARRQVVGVLQVSEWGWAVILRVSARGWAETRFRLDTIRRIVARRFKVRSAIVHNAIVHNATVHNANVRQVVVLLSIGFVAGRSTCDSATSEA